MSKHTEVEEIEEVKKWAIEAEGFEYEPNLSLGEYSGRLDDFDFLLNKALTKAKEEQKQFDAYLIRTSGWHTAEKLARKLFGVSNVNWYTQKQMDGAREQAKEEEREKWLNQKFVAQYIGIDWDGEKVTEKYVDDIDIEPEEEDHD